MKTKSKVESPNDSTPLFNLPDSFIATGGEIDRLAVAAGYTSGRDWVNSGNQWTATLAEAREMLMVSRAEIEEPAPPQPVQAATREAHTPGPWETGCLMTSVEVRPKGWNVPMCIADCHTKNAPQSEAERVANARLIAAAPELLEACKRAEMLFIPLAFGSPSISALLLVIHSAIARAEGGAS